MQVIPTWGQDFEVIRSHASMGVLVKAASFSILCYRDFVTFVVLISQTFLILGLNCIGLDCYATQCWRTYNYTVCILNYEFNTLL